MSDYAKLLEMHRPTTQGDEAGYAAVWRQQALVTADLVELAIVGGLLADRMAWVFVAGYQSALRHTFPSIPMDGLAAFAVSEDRKGNPPLAGVQSHEHDGKLCVSGYKTWVACSTTLAYLLIKANRGAAAQYFCLPRQTPGLTLQDKYGTFLPEMSQGIAKLDRVATPAALDQSAVASFGLRETLYIYLAFCAWAGMQGAAPEQCQGLILRLAALIRQLPVDAQGLAELKAVDADVQALRESISPRLVAGWQADQRLIAMYSPGIQKRQL